MLIFGGTFDPPHRAHVDGPRHVASALKCHRILYVPTSANPLKSAQPTPAHHRLAMLRLALADCPACEISTIEIDRPGPAYTVDTLAALRGAYDESIRFRLLLGADAALSFHAWREPARIIDLAAPAVMLRGGIDLAHFARAMREHWTAPEVNRWLDWIVDVPVLDDSASHVRQLLRDGASAIPAIAPSVLAYIREHGLFCL